MSACQSVLMLISNVTPTAILISRVYLPFCLPKCTFQPSTPYPQPPPPPSSPAYKKCLSLFTCRSVCPPVCLYFRLSVCLFFLSL